MESAKPPAVNFWSVRQEQMAARASASTAAPPPASVTVSPSPSSKLPPAQPRQKKPTSSPVPPVSDKDTWPEVTASLSKESKEKDVERSKEASSKKVEKTKKWVPIPAEELQATADALQASSSNRRSKGQSGEKPRDRSSTRKAPGQNTNRGPPSQAASTSHSRVHSRSGSTHSSPKAAGRRRLPDREPNSVSASPKVNGSLSVEERPLKPTSSSHPSKPGSPLPPTNAPHHSHPHLRHPLPPPPHLYHQSNPPRPDEFSQPIYDSAKTNGQAQGKPKWQFGSIDLSMSDGERKVLIGLTPEELPSVTRGIKSLTVSSNGKKSRRPSIALPVSVENGGVVDRSTARATSQKWEFGTTTATTVENTPLAVGEDGGAARLSPLSMSLSASPGSQPPPGLAPVQPDSLASPPGLGSQPQHPPGLARPQIPSPRIAQALPPSHPASDADFEVRDYGYGFGRVSGTGRAVEMVKEEMAARERERLEWERSRREGSSQRVPRPYDGPREAGRGGSGIRRGGGSGGRGGPGGGPSLRQGVRRSGTPQSNQPPPPFPHPIPHGPPVPIPFIAPPPPGVHHPLAGPPPGSLPHDGLPSPTYFAGMRGNPYLGVGGPPPPPGAVPFLPIGPGHAPLPPLMMPLPLSGAPSVVSPTASLSGVIGLGPAGAGVPGGVVGGMGVAAPQGPPIPAPITNLPFVLDPTRYYLLGQLEYYLSHENMAQDFFLRKQMDSQGWIPISTIASFKRVLRLTPDVNLVRDVLYLSSMVQVREQWVRMGGWEKYVLPDAPKSVVPDVTVGQAGVGVGVHGERSGEGYIQGGSGGGEAPDPNGILGLVSGPPPGVQSPNEIGPPASVHFAQNGPVQGGEGAAPDRVDANGGDGVHEEGTEEDEEEDVVFVMGRQPA